MTLVMGVLNVTPDSFSDGGRWADAEAAVEHGVALMAQGADIVDVGGESTRPGAARPSTDEEVSRVLPVVAGLHERGVTTSIDTMRAVVAAQCVAAGAAIINDVSGGLADPDMASVAASTGVPFIVMHWRGHSETMNDAARYDDVVAEVVAHLRARVQDLVTHGVDADQIIVDPGFGFAKDAHHNWTLFAGLPEVAALGHRVLVGASRKRFLGDLPGVNLLEAAERDVATAATSLLAAQAGAWAVRVHDVPSTAHALGVLARVQRG